MAYRNHRNAASRSSIYQTVTDRIISSLKVGVIPWEKPWKTPRYAGGPFPRIITPSEYLRAGQKHPVTAQR